MRVHPAARVTTGRHVRATADGRLALTLRGPSGCRGIVTLKSERRIASRWLERGRPRVVTLAKRPFELPPDGRIEVCLRLSAEHLALLRRMGSIRAVARVVTAVSRDATAVTIHAPARRGTGRRLRSRPNPR